MAFKHLFKQSRLFSSIAKVLDRDIRSGLADPLDRTLHKIGADSTIYEAAESMVRHKVGALTVVDGINLHGIITERDLLKWGNESTSELQCDLIDYATPKRELITMSHYQTLRKCLHLMLTNNMRHMPLYHSTTKDSGFPDSLLSMRDIARQVLWWNEHGYLDLPISVQDLLDKQQQPPVMMEHSDSVLDAVQKMNAKKIGSIIVHTGSVQDNYGMFSESDFFSNVMLKYDRHHKDIKLFDVMTSGEELICVKPYHSIHMCLRMMLRMHIRHLPVIDDNKCIGCLSLRSLFSGLLDNLEKP